MSGEKPFFRVMPTSPTPVSEIPSPAEAGGTSGIRLPVLDGLRGVAALIVVAFHIFDSDPVNSVNHGYLAVDFFFLLSGYVTGHAYDGRWGRMSFGAYVRRRLVRLHPMVVVGSILGAVFFYFGTSDFFGLVGKTSVGALLFSTLLGALLIPSVKSMDVRGWGESYPLNGPAWSLFFEYVANLAYAAGLRHLGRKALGGVSVALAGLLAYVILSSEAGTVSFGWLFTGEHVWRGMVRVMFPFLTGLFLFRLGRTIRMKHGMTLTALGLVVLFAMPRVGPEGVSWMNGLYESVVIILLLPVILLVGAGSRPVTRFGERACAGLGEISYPLYLVHYPIHYVFFAWLHDTKPAWGAKMGVAAGVYLACLALAYAVMRFVDTPIRRRLARFAR